MHWPVETTQYTATRQPSSFKQIFQVKTTLVPPTTDTVPPTTADTVPPTTYTVHGTTTGSGCLIRRECLVGGEKSVWRVRIEGVQMAYTPGDSVLLRVSNEKKASERILRQLGCLSGAYLQFERVHIKTGRCVFSFQGRLGDYIEHFLDITSLPSKYCLYRLSLCAGEGRRDALEYLSSREGSRDYFSLNKNWNTLADIIEEFQVSLKLEDLLELSTEIKPRAFSLIQSPSQDIEFICGLITKNNGESERKGHFSTFISQVTDKQQAWVVQSGNPQPSTAQPAPQCPSTTTQPTTQPSTALVYGVVLKPNKLMQMRASDSLLIATGTGVAPFVSFLRHRSQNRLVLFYGCRAEEESILHGLGMVSGPGSECVYRGAREYVLDERTAIYIVYSRTNLSIHINTFLKINEERVAFLLETLQSVFICGKREVQKSLSEHFAQAHPQMPLYIDDWS
ncbi:hypothetical protein NEDG_02009 [Nematocida displodere]|uniref:NADPH--hemoprotein reductase n=1 Tax=Nematocida displodere TaxID=1805483 RepID=A0A177EET3_9MICR|nr:hypothetical protein NEDG_02009 [Nematocida displodere]